MIQFLEFSSTQCRFKKNKKKLFLLFSAVKTYENMTLQELEENEDEFSEEDEIAIEMYRWNIHIVLLYHGSLKVHYWN